MATERERKLVIALLKERVEKQTGKKVVFVEQNSLQESKKIITEVKRVSNDDYEKTKARAIALIRNVAERFHINDVEELISIVLEEYEYDDLSTLSAQDVVEIAGASGLESGSGSDDELDEQTEKKVVKKIKRDTALETVLQEKKKIANKMTIDKDDYIKAIKKADRELEKDTNTGFKRGQTAHKSEKDYSRKIKHKNNYQIDEDSRGDATFEDILKIQRKQLDDWKQLLQPNVYEALEKWATEKNDQKKSPYDIIRGTSLDNFIGNYLKGYTPPN